MILLADSGSTKTDWCVADGGQVVRRVATQGINPFHQDEPTIAAIVNDELLPRLNDDAISEVYFYGSGCREECVPMMMRVLGRFIPAAVVVEAHGDLLGAARAVCGAGAGIACILGTGANSCLYDGHNIIMNTPPLGYILGDEGSGAVLGRHFINAMFKDLLPAEIKHTFLRETGMTMADIIRRVYREPLANRFLASLAPFIHRHIGNPPLRSLVVDNFRDFFRRNVVRYERRDLPVGAIGSIAYYFSDELKEAADSEHFTIGRIERSPIDGLVDYYFRLNIGKKNP